MDLIIETIKSETIIYNIFYKNEKIGYAHVKITLLKYLPFLKFSNLNTLYYKNSIRLDFFPDFNPNTKICYIEFINIESRFQKQGFGSILIRKIIECHRELPIFLIADPMPGGFKDLNTLLHFYKSLGFVTIKEFKTVMGLQQVLMVYLISKL